MYLSTKFQVSDIIVASFRQGEGGVIHPLTSKWTPEKPTQIRVKFLHWVPKSTAFPICTVIFAIKILENIATYTEKTILVPATVS